MLYPSQIGVAAEPRVVVTGAGIVTSLGLGWAQNSEALRAGKTAFRQVTRFDVSRHQAKTAAEVDLPAELPPTLLTHRQRSRMDRASLMLLLAAREALQQAQPEDAGQMPLVLGTSAGGMALGEEYVRQALQLPLRKRGQPTRALHYQAHHQARLVADALGLFGPVTITSNACAAGASAIGHAWEMLRQRRASAVLTGGYDALSQFVFAGFDSLHALSLSRCRPFDAHRDGLVLGEGAGVLMLETLEHAGKRKADVLGEIIGYGAAFDPHHLTQPHPDGEATFRSMQLACEHAGISARDVDYINAHGTGTPLNDRAEALAVNRFVTGLGRTMPVSSTKASTGHLLGGAGSVEVVACLMSLCGQWLPPETTLEEPDPSCSFRVVNAPEDAALSVVLSNSCGFGGVNATVALRRWE